MFCPLCNNTETKVLESRIHQDTLRRRRECLHCTNRFTTYERAVFNLKVTKKDGREQNFDLQKLQNSIHLAFGKADPETINSITKKVHQRILAKKTNPIKSAMIGKLALAEIKKTNKIAYLRFASIYKSIDDPKKLEKELQTIV